MNSLRNFLVCALAACVLPVVSARAGALQDAEAAYGRGDYAAAARSYETAIAGAPAPSAGLYYDLGMALMKNGQKPEAALAFRRSLLLDPRDDDARVSLSEIERSEGIPAVKDTWTDWLQQKAPLSGLLIAGTVVFWAGAFLLLGAFFRRSPRGGALAGAVVVILIGVALGAASLVSDPKLSNRKDGVLVAAKGVPLLSAPADQSAELAVLPPASCVRILRDSGEWTYCEAVTGEKGWLPSKNLQAVVPKV